MSRSRRDLLKLFAASSIAGMVPPVTRAEAASDIYAFKKFGNVRVIHITDTHGQHSPGYAREPSVNIGVGADAGLPPHLVGRAFLDKYGLKIGSPEAYACTFLDFEEAAHRYGAMGGFAHIKTLVDSLRHDAGPGNSVLLDGGDLWQGSALAHVTNGAALVELGDLLGVDAMTGHWEFTYGEPQFRKNLASFKGDFIAQNVFLTDEALFNGAPSFDSSTGRVFKPYVIKEIGGVRVAVIGQAFPYVPIAHPQRFTPDWSFGIREPELQKVVDEARQKQRVQAVVLLSHNGMDVDRKLASRIRGIDVILGGHTHDITPSPSIVENPSGKTLVVNGGQCGKFVGVLDLDVRSGGVKDIRYELIPVFSNLIKPDPKVSEAIQTLEEHTAPLRSTKLGVVENLLYRRGNFNGAMDQVICDALIRQLDVQIALSPGFRWGVSFLPGHSLTMSDLYSELAITYPDAYVQEMTGAQLKSAMEDVADNLFNKDPYRQQGGDMVRVGGMNYSCSPNADFGRRISDMTLDSGEAIAADKTYKVAGWASVSLAQTGKPIWDVVAAHIKATGGVKVPRLNQVKVLGLGNNPGYAP